MFVVRHRANNMKDNITEAGAVWFVDFGASNHMMSHKKWFMNMREPEKLQRSGDWR
jgi:hypothetical protein